ncbi:MAG: hypothetical protein HQK52_21375 [Oligoflexia bacterium]|nr:hypothetical protein [Oligoflexia bacterium]
MIKKKTSKKQEISFKDIPSLKLKKNIKSHTFNPTERMKDKKYISKALWDCLVADDVDGFKEILMTHLYLVDKDVFAADAGIPRRTLFRMLSSEGNPTLANIAKIVHKICA